MRPAVVVGAGLAGAEAAWQLATAGVPVLLFEMRPARRTAVHRTGLCAELVCSNSMGSSLEDRAAGVLQAELEALGSLLLRCARAAAVPAGQALAVDRTAFAEAVTAALESHPLVEIAREEVRAVPDSPICVLATGPLTSDALAADLQARAGAANLHFFDAVSPVVVADTLDASALFRASRYGHGGPDYWNVPLDRPRYEWLVAELQRAERHPLRDFETADPRARRFFERCVPVEVLAARGRDALRFGPLRPVGLRDPRTGRRPYAVLQLRPESRAGTLYNLVGFQTSLRHGEQERILCGLPGFGRAEFARLGSMHRNTYLCAPRLVRPTLEWRERPGLFIAGQIAGMEGYLGNIGSGLLAGRNAARRFFGAEPEELPGTTVLGALSAHVAEAPADGFQPMKAEFGLLPPLPGGAPQGPRNRALAARSAADLAAHLRRNPMPAPAGAAA